jgi:hypothetical protein
VRRRIGGVVCVAALIAGSLAYEGTASALTATSTSAGNSFTAGTITLSDNTGSSAMFTTAGVVPGASGSWCVTVTHTGTVTPSAPLQAYVASGSATDTPGFGGSGIAAHLNWSVEVADGSGVSGSGAACTGLTGTTLLFGNTADFLITPGRMLSDFVATKNAYSAGGTSSVSSGWTPMAGVTSSKVFRFNYRMAANTPDSTRSAQAVVTITWQVRS